METSLNRCAPFLLPHVASGALETAIGEPCTLAGNPMNARFWVWHKCGWVKLTLVKGQSLNVHSGHNFDEGWTSESEGWGFDGEIVHWQWVSEGRDCDGYSASYGEAECPIHALRGRDAYGFSDESSNVGMFTPEWQRVSSENRDEYAEAAGY